MPFECDDVPVVILADGQIRTTAVIGYQGKDERFEIEPGFVSDQASTPRWLSALAPVAGLVTLAALLHDWLLRIRRILWEKGATQPVSSVDIDGLFRRALRETWYRDGRGRIVRLNRVQRGIYWLGVRWGALFSAYRREGWWRTAHIVLPWSLVLLAPLALYALVSLVVLGGAWAAGRLLGLLWHDPLPEQGIECEPVEARPARRIELRDDVVIRSNHR